jgi:hypothetical protein
MFLVSQPRKMQVTASHSFFLSTHRSFGITTAPHFKLLKAPYLRTIEVERRIEARTVFPDICLWLETLKRHWNALLTGDQNGTHTEPWIARSITSTTLSSLTLAGKAKWPENTNNTRHANKSAVWWTNRSWKPHSTCLNTHQSTHDNTSTHQEVWNSDHDGI